MIRGFNIWCKILLNVFPNDQTSFLLCYIGIVITVL